MSRPLIARIDAAALAHNLAVARQAAPQSRILSVIKANGYGHGLLRVARALRATDGFAVLTLDEAAQLRKEGFTHPIVLLEGFFSVEELGEIAQLRLRPVLHREDQIDRLARAHLPHRLDVLLKINTGMNRLGLPPARAAEALAKLRDNPNVAGVTLMTHFARADDDPESVAAQRARFMLLANAAGLPTRLPITLANSAATLRHPDTHGDWVRPGIMLYGCSPFAESDGPDLGLLPAMSLESRLIAVQRVKKGEGVGYGHTFLAERDTTIGVVACGYADGYPRHAPNGTPVVVADHVCRLAGRVSMDMLCVDLGNAPAAHVGSPVELWGANLPVERVAAAAGTIGYELLTALAPRVRVEEV